MTGINDNHRQHLRGAGASGADMTGRGARRVDNLACLSALLVPQKAVCRFLVNHQTVRKTGAGLSRKLSPLSPALLHQSPSGFIGGDLTIAQPCQTACFRLVTRRRPADAGHVNHNAARTIKRHNIKADAPAQFQHRRVRASVMPRRKSVTLVSAKA